METGAFESCTISNSIGAVVMTAKMANSHTALQVNKIPAGMYYVTLRGASGVSVKKFVKQ